MNRRLLALTSLSAVFVVIGACTDTGTGSLQSGIEGSGIRTSPTGITASGVVTALGSIVVNDVRYDVAEAAVSINGLPATPVDLAPGQVTVVEGALDADGTTGTAARVLVEVQVAGPVSAVYRNPDRLVILGQTIAVQSNTVIPERDDTLPLGGLAVGNDVEVSGFADSSGVLHARRISSRRIRTPLLLTGYIANLDANASTFTVNGQAVNYAGAGLTGFDAPFDGARVRISLQGLAAGTLNADRIELLDPGLPGALGDLASVQGWITRFESQTDFDVDGHPVVGTQSSAGVSGDIGLDAFVSVTGTLLADGVVQATGIRAVLPGRIVGGVTVGEVSYGLSGLLTGKGDFRLNIEEASPGPPVLDSGLGQLVGHFSFEGNQASGDGVLFGEACALAGAGRFCGKATPFRIDVTKQGIWDDQGSAGVIRVETDSGVEIWPVALGYSGGRAGFDPIGLEVLAGLYELNQAEFTSQGKVVMSVDTTGQFFFQSAESGCVGNGVLSEYQGKIANLYEVRLRLDSCTGAFAYLNAEYEGLATLESLTPWSYDLSVLPMWLSTDPGVDTPAAFSLWGIYIE